MSDINVKIGKRLLEARKARGLSRDGLGELMSMSGGAIQAHENGRNGINAEAAALYVKHLRISYEWLFAGVGHMNVTTGDKSAVMSILNNIEDENTLQAWLTMGKTAIERK